MPEIRPKNQGQKSCLKFMNDVMTETSDIYLRFDLFLLMEYSLRDTLK
ncbi:MAG: hypothetical protein LBH12_06980 [Dysgonamonadaceae bacterium]|nr:hypothetical protein [Dysgonamonadaceae bacterium]